MKKLIPILLPVIILVGLVAGGIVKIPGVNDSPPKKKHAKKATTEAASNKPKPAPDLGTPKPTPAPVDAPAKPTFDPEKGNEKIAELWGAMETDKLKDVIEKWPDKEAAPVLAVMDSSKVAELFGALKPERASALSKELQRLGSIVPPPPKAG
jgi:hypothetical protein